MTKFKLGYFYRSYKVLFKQIRIRLFIQGRRSDKHIQSEYGTFWQGSETNQNEHIGVPQFYFVHNKFALLRRIDRKQFLIKHINGYLQALQPKRVLEVGAGAGINLLSLAILNPDISFEGIELTHEGVKTAEKLRDNPPLKILVFMLRMSESEIQDRLKRIKLKFTQGDMRSMPFPDNSFDFVFSYLAIEQIPQEYNKCFKEVSRIIKPHGAGHALFTEAFKEAQHKISQRVFLWAADYFRWSLRTLAKENLRIVRYEEMAFQSFFMGLGSVLVEKH